MRREYDKSRFALRAGATVFIVAISSTAKLNRWMISDQRPFYSLSVMSDMSEYENNPNA